MSRPHVLIVGAGGAVGRRLARLLARSGLFRVSLGVRAEAAVEALAQELRGIDPQGEFGAVVLDRHQLGAERLREIGCWIVVDCAGPGETAGTGLVEAAIAAHCHVIDLEDGRGHLDALHGLDERARAAGLAVLSGAGLHPALTHAVINSLAAGWRQIDSLDVTLAPSRGACGPARLASLVARRLAGPRLFEAGGWQDGRDVAGAKDLRLEGLGRRRLRLFDSVDLDLLVARFRPRLRARLRLGLEPRLLDRLLDLGAQAKRLRLEFLARGVLGLCSGAALQRLGRPGGGLLVELAGLDARLEPRVARWMLLAPGGEDADLPAVAAAAAIVALVKGEARAGVRTAAGVVTLEGLRPWLAGLALDIRTASFKREVPLLARAAGASFAALPERLQRLHRGRPAVMGTGQAAMLGPANGVARLLARVFGLPGEGSNVPWRLIVEARDGREVSALWFGEQALRFERRHVGQGLVEDRLGLLCLRLAVVAGTAGLELSSVGGRLGRLPLPRALCPRLRIREEAELAGERLRVEADLSLPGIGRLFGYRGWVEF